jgi:hypothetical protein
VLGLALLASVGLVVGAAIFGGPAGKAAALTASSGGAVVWALIDIYRMLTTGRGIGRLSGHVSAEAHPASFRLHIALLVLLAAVFAFVFIVGLRSLLQWNA